MAIGLALLLVVIGVLPAMAQELDVSATAAILMEYSSGDIIYEKNSHQPLPMASITKVMTMVIALEQIRDGLLGWDDVVTASEYAKSMGGSQIWLETGEQMSVKDLLYAIAVGSANDAAVAIAEHIAGSEANFAAMMNQRAKELGMDNTVFSNASGLPPRVLGLGDAEHHSSAYDLALLSRHALTVPNFLELVSTYEYTMRQDSSREPHLYSYNTMLDRVLGSGRRYGYAGLDGIKTGMTSDAGYCLAATAQRDNLRLISVVLNSPTAQARTQDTTALLNYGFRHYTAVNLARKGQILGKVEVHRGNVDAVEVAPARDLSVGVRRGEEDQVTTWFEWDEDSLTAPIPQGTTVGYLIAGKDQMELSRVPLLAQQEVEKGTWIQNAVRSTKRLFRNLIPGPSN